jgi:transforming growth factor-beta-induced protein
MQLKSLLPALLAVSVSAVPLTQVLQQNNGTLSTLICKLTDSRRPRLFRTDNSLALLNKVPQITNSLSQARGITILAPSNDAFTKFLAANPSAAQLVNNTTAVSAVLQYHVLNGMLMSGSFNTTPIFVSTLLTTPSFANVTGGQKVSLQLMNGMPTILSGFKQGSTVVKADVMFDGGVIHIVDTVLTVPASPAETAIDTGLTSIAGALSKVNLVGPLNALRDVTVFAPSNLAFEAISSIVNGASMSDLNNVLRYHVITGQVKFSTDLAMNGMQMTLQTALGESVTIRTENGQVFVNSAKVIIPDIITSNGVVHVIDK